MKEIITELQTLRDFIRWAVSQFNKTGLYFGHGTETALDEAVALVLHALYLPHTIDSSLFEARLTYPEREKLYQLIQTRITKRIPLAYLTHEILFAGLLFYVDERVIIPRSPIAELIQHQFQPWIKPDYIHTILDLCTGSGCIAIACAKAFPEAVIDASDISSDVLAVAKINSVRHQVEEQVTFYLSDLFDVIPRKKYDIIISNPPYVDAADMAALPTEYTHEPKLALAGGIDGLDYVTQILKKASNYLNSNGILIVEVGNSEEALIKRYPDIPFTWLEFENGGDGVFLLTAKELLKQKV